mmetsp:Transcript_11018/g.13777  ORF Transcript_11018/g.13777 Transcript_11018/m.13777 type:complete len:236 (-) Transcript_11018:185-892(-)
MSSRTRDIGYTLASVFLGIVTVELQRWFRKRKLKKDFDTALCTKQYVKVVVSMSLSASFQQGKSLRDDESKSVDVLAAVKTVVSDSMPAAEIIDISLEKIQSEAKSNEQCEKEDIRVSKESKDILHMAERELIFVLRSDEILNESHETTQLKFAVGISNGIILVREGLYTCMTWVAMEDVLNKRKKFGCACRVLDETVDHSQINGSFSTGLCVNSKTLVEEAVTQAWKQIILDSL